MTDQAQDGPRERKRRQTSRRIVDAAIKLFGVNGFEATTVDAIAAEAGISRRTFFHYFASKDDVLVAMEGGLGERLVEALAAQPAGATPFATMRAALRAVAAPYDQQQLLVVDQLMRSSEAVQTRKQAGYLRDERLLAAALAQRWPEENPQALALIAALAIATVRLTLDAWSAGGGTRTLLAVLADTFAALDSLLAAH